MFSLFKKTLPFIVAGGMLAASQVALAKQITIGMSFQEMNNDYFVTMKQALDQAAADIGAKVYVADARHDVAKQIGDVEDMLQKKVDILLINPTDSVGVQSAVISAHKAGAVVVAIDAQAEGRWTRSSDRKTTTPASRRANTWRKRWAAKARWRSSTASRWCRSWSVCAALKRR